MGAEGRGFVALNKELRGFNVPGLDRIRVAFCQVFLAIVAPKAKGRDVEFDGRGFALELLGDGAFQLGLVDAEQFGEDADIHDVGHEFGDFGVDLASQLAHGDGVGDDVLAFHGLSFGVAVPNHDRAGFKGSEVLVPCGGIHKHLNVGAVAGCLVALVRQAHDVPGGQARNVGRKEVLAADRHAHLKQRLKQNEVGRLGAGSVRSGDVDGKVVHDAVHGGHHAGHHRRPLMVNPLAFTL